MAAKILMLHEARRGGGGFTPDRISWVPLNCRWLGTFLQPHKHARLHLLSATHLNTGLLSFSLMGFVLRLALFLPCHAQNNLCKSMIRTETSMCLWREIKGLALIR